MSPKRPYSQGALALAEGIISVVVGPEEAHESGCEHRGEGRRQLRIEIAKRIDAYTVKVVRATTQKGKANGTK